MVETLSNPLLAARLDAARAVQLRRFEHDAVAERLLAFVETMS